MTWLGCIPLRMMWEQQSRVPYVTNACFRPFLLTYWRMCAIKFVVHVRHPSGWTTWPRTKPRTFLRCLNGLTPSERWFLATFGSSSSRPKDLVLDDLDRDKFVRIVPPEEIPKRSVMLGQRAGRQHYWFHVTTSRHEEIKINWSRCLLLGLFLCFLTSVTTRVHLQRKTRKKFCEWVETIIILRLVDMCDPIFAPSSLCAKNDENQILYQSAIGEHTESGVLDTSELGVRKLGDQEEKFSNRIVLETKGLKESQRTSSCPRLALSLCVL